MKIPRCMSTQHPDNASAPFFAANCVLAGEDEIREAYYAFSHLGCDEQMWDVEGKEIDTYVVKKLLSYYPEYFRQNELGRDLRITLRVPNPTVEKAEAKILLETLESIPRSYDAARLFYGHELVPIFEVILPMTTSARCIDRIYRYYLNHIIGRQYSRFREDDITIAQWIGDFLPSSIQVIPLFEDVPTMLKVDQIMDEYLADKEVEDQRVFLARSDTAMNYGLASAALANKLALVKFEQVSRRTGVQLHPILGMGSAPFRGGLHPHSVQRVGEEYPSVVTFTIQSAFKFDYPVSDVQDACRFLKSRNIGPAAEVDEERALDIIQRYSQAYRARITELAPQICRMSRYVPKRRARKLHVGQFGYARAIGEVSLPRAISFTCSMYSLGLPPELLAFESLDRKDLDFVLETYPSFRSKIEYAMAHTDFEGPFMTSSLQKALLDSGFDSQPDGEHLEVVRGLRQAVDACDSVRAGDLMLRAAL
ncbi:MAG: phosphoenolpyruvate carboxylase, partial [Desulfonatronovibrionaceae bacterium]